ncbi:MAG: hypothetical protein VXW27_10335, partial [Pseudomonadota bacterium]|nr:hypothetical protein [Pseudomonadota bacterium]
LMARQKNGIGQPMAATGAALAEMTLAELHRRSGVALMDTALAHQGAGEGQASGNPLLAGLYREAAPGGSGPGDAGIVSLSLRLETGLVALGASAATHYPHVAARMGVDLTVPDHAEVAGAVGAARARRESSPVEGRFIRLLKRRAAHLVAAREVRRLVDVPRSPQQP